MTPMPPPAAAVRGRRHRVDALRIVLAIVLGIFFTVAAWQITEPAVRAICLVVVALWVAEMLLGTATSDYRTTTPRMLTLGTLALVLSQIGASAFAFAGGATLLPVAIAGIIRLVRREDRPQALIASVLAADGIALVLGGILLHAKLELVVICVLVCAASALTARIRSQRVRATERERALLEQQVAAQRERAENAALQERARIARDLHDVLAHSLGALTLQLDAAHALAEAQRWDELAPRLARARGLAADGLAESREAVAALREDRGDLSAGAQGLIAGVQALIAQHEDVAGPVLASLDGARASAQDLTPAGTDALLRAVQEMLTNARRHASGGAVELALQAEDGRVSAIARTGPTGAAGMDPAGMGATAMGPTAVDPTATDPSAKDPSATTSAGAPGIDRAAPGAPGVGRSAPGAAGVGRSAPGAASHDLIGEGAGAGSQGGGFGLLGMRERCEALGGGASARRTAGGGFETTASVPLVPGSPPAPLASGSPHASLIPGTPLVPHAPLVPGSPHIGRSIDVPEEESRR